MGAVGSARGAAWLAALLAAANFVSASAEEKACEQEPIRAEERSWYLFYVLSFVGVYLVICGICVYVIYEERRRKRSAIWRNNRCVPRAGGRGWGAVRVERPWPARTRGPWPAPASGAAFSRRRFSTPLRLSRRRRAAFPHRRLRRGTPWRRIQVTVSLVFGAIFRAASVPDYRQGHYDEVFRVFKDVFWITAFLLIILYWAELQNFAFQQNKRSVDRLRPRLYGLIVAFAVVRVAQGVFKALDINVALLICYALTISFLAFVFVYGGVRPRVGTHHPLLPRFAAAVAQPPHSPVPAAAVAQVHGIGLLKKIKTLADRTAKQGAMKAKLRRLTKFVVLEVAFAALWMLAWLVRNVGYGDSKCKDEFDEEEPRNWCECSETLWFLLKLVEKTLEICLMGVLCMLIVAPKSERNARSGSGSQSGATARSTATGRAAPVSAERSMSVRAGHASAHTHTHTSPVARLTLSPPLHPCPQSSKKNPLFGSSNGTELPGANNPELYSSYCSKAVGRVRVAPCRCRPCFRPSPPVLRRGVRRPTALGLTPHPVSPRRRCPRCASLWRRPRLEPRRTKRWGVWGPSPRRRSSWSQHRGASDGAAVQSASSSYPHRRVDC